MQQTQTTSASMSYPPPPASPTLTNPDMILPYGDPDNTYSSSQRPAGLPSPPHIWNDMTPMDLQYAIGQAHSTGPPTPLTPIIYGNGTMLSDIGEVTEAESTAGRKPRPAPLKFSSTNSSSTAVNKRSKAVNHRRTASIDSTSTVTSEPRKTIFSDFDDTVSVDDSVFQGDDEESVVEDPYSHEYEMPAHLAQALSRKASNITTTTIASDVYEEEEGEVGEAGDRHSSGTLSRRAELILANAKKRLDTMEGNLSRARSSLYITPSGSMTSINSSSPLNRSTPSPGHPDGRIIPQLGLPTSKYRQYLGDSPDSPKHTRVFSETSVPYTLRSLSAAGSRERLRFPIVPLQQSKSSQDIRDDLRRSASLNMETRSSTSLSLTTDANQFQAPLETLSEDDINESFVTGCMSVRSTTAEPYLFASQGLGRSNSSVAMRDLRGQMQDLKGRISSLRDRAKEENMKRRSLQPIESPSPFTAAEQWYATTRALQEETVKATVGGPDLLGLSFTAPAIDEEPVQGQDNHVQDDYAHEDEHEDGHDNGYGEARQLDEEDPAEDELNNGYDTAAENEYYGDDDHIEDYSQIEDYSDNSGRESMASMYHDTLPVQVSHEDREDRFDYENFFLHSAMGSLSRQRASHRDSYASDDSTETTRGPELSNDQDSRKSGHTRQSSMDSVSTMATFATATEGRGSRYNSDYEDEEDEIVEYPALQAPPSESRIPQPPRRQVTPVSIKRSTFGSPMQEILNGQQNGQVKSFSPISRPSSVRRSVSVNDSRPVSVIHDPQNKIPGPGHRPSLSSVSSSGSARSFPLVNRSKPTTPVDTPTRFTFPTESSPLRSSSSDAQNAKSNGNGNGNGARSTELKSVHMLAHDDQVLVERLVAALGECVLGLQDIDQGSYEGKVFRRRLDAARRVLEGTDEAA